MPKKYDPSLPLADLEPRIYTMRGRKVMLDSDLALLYGTETRRLNEAVKRNAIRFPDRFMFRLNDAEAAILRSQFATSSKRKLVYQPLAFTEHGVVMLSSILNSTRAVQVSIMVVEAFIRMRELMASSKDIAARVEKLERGQERAASVLEMLVEDIDRCVREVNRMKSLPHPQSARSALIFK